MKAMPFLLALALVAMAAGTGAAQPLALKPLEGVKRVVFLGDSITHAGGYVDDVEAYLLTRYPRHRFEVINLGLPSETVSGLSEPNHAGGKFPRPDLHERLERVLGQTKPDLVVACYGMNDGIYYPFSDERFRTYQEGVMKLHVAVAKSKATLWLVTPPPFDPVPLKGRTLPEGKDEYGSDKPFEGYDAVLKRYSAWLVEQRKKDWNVIDVHTPLADYLAEWRKQKADFRLAADGVHLDATGHHLIAREVLHAWGAPANDLDFTNPKSISPELMKQVGKRQQVLKDAYLTEVGHKRPGMAKGLPLDEALKQAAEMEAKIRELAKPESP
jgi:lysophospholipase L1-like esterase